ncbi:MAG: ATP-binding cassette domain-containing protein, partial [Planctomycetaceae bacterium]
MSETLKMPQPQLSAVAIEKTYQTGAQPVQVLRGVRLLINKGDFVSIVGKSGSGKSTLMHLMGLLDTPD